MYVRVACATFALRAAASTIGHNGMMERQRECLGVHTTGHPSHTYEGTDSRRPKLLTVVGGVRVDGLLGSVVGVRS